MFRTHSEYGVLVRKDIDNTHFKMLMRLSQTRKQRNNKF